ncbi:MAG: N-formylglutamate amidohydrolase [Pseudomonadota bacterium]
MLPPKLLGPDDVTPVRARLGTHPRLLVVVDHAAARVPSALSNLGLSEAELERHIAWDIGAAEIARTLASHYRAQLLESAYSRLVIDPNRYPHDPSAMPLVSDGTAVPGNSDLSAAARHRRVEEIFRPYHAAIGTALDVLGAEGFLLSVHTMTDHPRNGDPRPEQIAVSWAADRRSAIAALDTLRRDKTLTLGDNTPYAIDLGEDFTTPEHAVRRGLPHLQVEVRQDLVAAPGPARDWAMRLVPAIDAALAI